MTAFEALHGLRYRFQVGRFEVGKLSILGPEIIHEDLKKVRVIRERLSTA